MLVDARSQPPLAVRDTADRILLVGSAAAPVGGDALEIEVVVGAGATAVIGSVAATSIFPGPHGERSRSDTDVAVAGGGRLLWWPEPLLSIAGSNHRSTTRVGLVAGARCTIVEEVSLGRSGQPSGTLELDLRVERAGVPIVHHVERFGPDEPGTGSSVGVADARHVISGVVVGVDPGDGAHPDRSPRSRRLAPRRRRRGDGARHRVRSALRPAAARRTPPVPATCNARGLTPSVAGWSEAGEASRRQGDEHGEDGDRPQHGANDEPGRGVAEQHLGVPAEHRARGPIRPSPSPAGARRTTGASPASTRRAHRRWTRRSTGTRRTTCPAPPGRSPTRDRGTSAAS